MIRSVLGLFIFAVALCAYIVVRPGSAPQEQAALPAAAVPADVTRAVTESLLPGTPLPQAAVAPSDVAPTPAPDMTPAPRANPIQTNERSIDATTNNVLAGLGLDLDVPDLPTTTDPLANMSSDALSNISASTGRAIPTRKAAPTSALETLVVAALQEGRPDAEIDSLINNAAVAGEIVVPEILVTSDGRVDTAVLLKAIVNQASMAAGGAAPAIPEVQAGEGTGVELRVVQRVEAPEQYRFYTVDRGDSLGAIALKFYGSVEKFQVIYEANRSILSSPDNIRVGQRLAIPNIDGQI